MLSTCPWPLVLAVCASVLQVCLRARALRCVHCFVYPALCALHCVYLVVCYVLLPVQCAPSCMTCMHGHESYTVLCFLHCVTGGSLQGLFRHCPLSGKHTARGVVLTVCSGQVHGHFLISIFSPPLSLTKRAQVSATLPSMQSSMFNVSKKLGCHSDSHFRKLFIGKNL